MTDNWCKLFKHPANSQTVSSLILLHPLVLTVAGEGGEWVTPPSSAPFIQGVLCCVQGLLTHTAVTCPGKWLVNHLCSHYFIHRWCPPTRCSTRRWRPCTPSCSCSAPASAGSYTMRNSGTLGRPAVATSAWLELSYWAGLLRKSCVVMKTCGWRCEEVKTWRVGN